MRTVAVIQARMGSTRLPGKVLRKLHDHSVLGHVLLRAKSIKNIDEVVVATTTRHADDAIVEEASKYNIRSVRGSENDVLLRYYLAGIETSADNVVRITSDCPLLDPAVSSNIVSHFLASEVDYCSNTVERSFPRGLDVEVFTMGALRVANDQATSEEFREHVTPYLYRNPNQFQISQWVNDVDYSHYRWTLDTPDDWLLIEKIYDRLYGSTPFFTWQSVVELMKAEPSLPLINMHVEQKKI